VNKISNTIINNSIFIFAFGISISLLVVILSLGNIAFKENPDWIKPDIRFATLGRHSQNNNIIHTSINEIAEISEKLAIKNYYHVSFESSDLEISDNLFKDIKIALYSDNFLKHLLDELEVVPNANISNDAVFLSHRYWVQELNSSTDVIGQKISIGPNGLTLSVSGILPEIIDFLGDEAPDLWIASHHGGEILSVSMSGDGEFDSADPAVVAFRRSLFRNIPSAMGLFALDKNQNISNLNEDLRSFMASTGEVNVMSSTQGLKHMIVKGVTFNYNAKEVMKKEWLILALLGLFFIFSNIVNFLSKSFSNSIKEIELIKLKTALGASKSHLAREILIRDLPIIISSMFISIFILYLLGKYFKKAEVLAGLTSNGLIEPHLNVILFSSVIISLFVYLCSMLPTIYLSNMNLFSRSSGGSKVLGTLTKVNAGIQIGFSLTLVCFSLNLYQKEILMFENLPFKTKSMVIELSTNNRSEVSPYNILRASFNGGSFNYAASNLDLTFPQGLRMEVNTPLDKGLAGVFATIIPVNKFYFRSLGINIIEDIGLDNKGVIINLAAINSLAASGEYLLGQSLNFKSGETNNSKLVLGVVENFPHFGLSNPEEPIIYELVDNFSAFSSIRLIVSEKNTEDFLNFARKVVDKEDGLLNLRVNGSVEKILKESNKELQNLINLAILLSTILCLFVLLSVYYSSFIDFELKKQKLGVFLALGATNKGVILYCSKNIFHLFTIAIPFWFLSSLVIYSWVVSKFKIDLLNLNILILSFCIVSLIIALASFLPLFQIFKKSIIKLL
jgi:hypothetical protein